MLRSRHQILSMLQSSAATTGVSLLNDGPGHRVRLRYQRGETDRALDGVVLLRSSHWYHYRLNVYGELDGIEIVVCGAHDSCLAVPVWSVAEAKVYQPGETAVPLETLQSSSYRSSKPGHRLLVAALLTSQPEALRIKASLPRSTRYRVEAELRQYANLRPGNRLKIV